jgi:hypothetical protein
MAPGTGPGGHFGPLFDPFLGHFWTLFWTPFWTVLGWEPTTGGWEWPKTPQKGVPKWTPKRAQNGSKWPFSPIPGHERPKRVILGHFGHLDHIGHFDPYLISHRPGLTTPGPQNDPKTPKWPKWPK